MKKIDVHIHLAVERATSMGGDPNLPELCYVGNTKEIRPHLEKQGICKAIIMSRGESVGTVGGANNEQCFQIVQSEPDFYNWMCNLDDRDPDSAYQRLAACKSQGAIGVGELIINRWIDDPMVMAIFAAAQKLRLPVTFHMSPEPGFHYGICDHAGLPLLEKALQTFPELILVGHSQVFWMEISGDCPNAGNSERNGFGRGPVKEGGRVEKLMERYPNLYADLSAYSGYCALTRDVNYGLYFLEKFQDRLLFGTDTINSARTPPLGDFLDQSVKAGNLSQAAWEKICFRNAQRIYGI